MVSKFSSNIFWLLLKAIMNYGTRFIYLITVVKLLLPAQYGIVATITAWVVGLFPLTSLGLDVTLARLTAKYDKGDPKQLKNLVGMSLKYSTIISVSVALFLILFGHFVVPNTIPVSLIILGIVLYFPLGFLNIPIYGMQKMKMLLGLDAVQNGLKIVLAIILFTIGFGYLGVVYGLYIAYFTVLALEFVIMRKHVSFGKVDLKNVISHSISGYVMNSFYAIAVQGRIIMASLLLSALDVGILAFTFGLASYMGAISGVINSAMFPLSSRNEQPKKLLKRGLLIILAIAIPVIIVIPFIFKPLVILLSRQEYLTSAKYIVLFLTAEVINSISILFLNQTYAIGHHKFIRKVYLLMLPVVLAANYLLMGKLGVFGAGISYLSYSLLLVSISGYFLYKKGFI